MIVLKENLKQELDKLNEEQLKQVANFIAFLEFAARGDRKNAPFWETATPSDRVARWRNSVAPSGTQSPNLPDEALRRDSIYDE
ncbi:MAG: hypothetical protein SW833_23695 [Cyanobacteriota bacterium]|nr:hypothetical protein [Cyanobacteriota bacterium]